MKRKMRGSEALQRREPQPRVAASTGRLVERLRALYPPPEWALYTQVRSATGASEQVRYADAVAVNLWPSAGWHAVFFEEKASRNDWLKEKANPAKAAEIGRYCSTRYLVVPAPWKLILLSLAELPRGWGLIEIGTGDPIFVHDAIEREAEPPGLDFMRALLRAGASGSGEAATGPTSAINRPSLSRTHVGLVCGHAVAKPLTKTLQKSLPCDGCAEGRPADVEVIEAMIEDGDDEDLLRLRAKIDARLGLETGT